MSFNNSFLLIKKVKNEIVMKKVYPNKYWMAYIRKFSILKMFEIKY